MKYVLTAKEMQQCDKNTMEYYGVPSAVLMERAALAVTEEIDKIFQRPSVFLIACGTGNNGGDGLAIARLLRLKGHSVMVYFPGNEQKCSVECARQLGIVRKYGIVVDDEIPDWDFDCIIDALFGIGLSRDIEGALADDINDVLNLRHAFRIAVDIPSGVNADNGHIMGAAFKADMTVTFGFAKPGQLLYPGAGYTGMLAVKEIGIDIYSLRDIRPHIRLLDEDCLEFLPERYDDSNKGSYGRIVIFAGSYNMAGAAAFSARAAYRSGAGLVKVVTEASNREIIQILVPEAILATYDEKTDMEEMVKEELGWADAVVIGPGIGRSGQAARMVEAVIDNVQIPCILDADALNILSEHMDWLGVYGWNIIATPHPGEMSRLMGCTIDEVKDDPIGKAAKFSSDYNVVTVLKDSRTVITEPDGDIWINVGGNDGMATGGSGDVLTGVIAALACREGMPMGMSAALGVLIHGMAGDAAAARLGTPSVTASDIVEGISDVMKPVYTD